MKGVKFFLFLFMLLSAGTALAYVLFPEKAAEAKLGPPDLAAARYVAAMFAGIGAASWCAFRDPVRNAAIVVMLIVINALTVLVALYDGIAGIEEWAPALVSLITGSVFTIGLWKYYPRAEKPLAQSTGSSGR